MARLNSSKISRHLPSITERVLELPCGKVLQFTEVGKSQRVAAHAICTVFAYRDVWDRWDNSGYVYESEKEERRRDYWAACEVALLRARLAEFENFAKDLDAHSLLPTYSDGWLSRAGKLYPAVRKFLWRY